MTTPELARRARRTVDVVTEQQPYGVMEVHDEFELRGYPEHLVAEISVTAPFEEAGSRAFRALAGHINGQNRSQSTLAMTAPVVQQAGSVRVVMTAPVLQSEGDSDDYVIAFVLPWG
ncbi:MAG: heme-binding protein [Ornithinibacter sp.]